MAEFNPFHNGHKYLVDSLKSDASGLVTAVMSGNFVQRGEPALLNVNLRTKMALESGVDLVLSLPLPYCISTAEKFALAGVIVLDSMNCLDSLAFGSESDSSEALKKCATNLQSAECDKLISKYIEGGVSYPTARENAVRELYGESEAGLLQNPNDILGIEYIKGLRSIESKMGVKTIKRTGANHDSKEGIGDIRSASHIRTLVSDLSEACGFMPKAAYEILDDAVKNGKVIDYKKFETSLLFKLRTLTPEDFLKLPDVSEGLEYRIYDAVRNSNSYEELLEKIKTKRYTLSRIRRILLFAYLDITKELLEAPVPYIRVLGFNEKGASLLKQAKKNSKLPLVTRLADLNNLDSDAKMIFELECKARDLFSLCLQNPDVCGKEMTEKIITI